MAHKIIQITDYSDLVPFSAVWNRLLESSEVNNIFLTWEWISTWIQTFLATKSAKGTLNVFMVYDRDELVAIAPLYIKRTRPFPGFSINRLGFLGDKRVGSDQLGFIIKKGKEYTCTYSLLDHIFDNKDWQYARFDAMPSNTVLFDAFVAYFNETGKAFSIHDFAVCPCISVTNSENLVLSRLSRKGRETLKRKLRSIETLTEFKDHRESFDSLACAFQAFAKLHLKRMKEKKEKTAFETPEFERFHMDLIKMLEGRKWLRLNFLVFDGKPVAAFYGFAYNQSYYYYLSGIDCSSIGKYSPGTVLLYHNVIKARTEGCTEFNFLRGNEPYKLKWSTHLRRTFSLEFYARSPRALIKMANNGIRMAAKNLVR